MKTAYFAAFAAVLAGFAATANITPAQAGDEEDALKECLETSHDNAMWGGVVAALGCAAGYVIETVSDDDENDEDDARPLPGSGKQLHAPLTAKPRPQQTIAPQNRLQPHRPTSGGAQVSDAPAFPVPAAKQRLATQKAAQPSAGLKTSTAAPRRTVAPAPQRRR
jgi:hypothetical protein